ncbi:hypothetical protein K1719_042158 [Acacia pycnantha]|nr:hypothetical protein K1719_042158 [Acacia pycnantha]
MKLASNSSVPCLARLLIIMMMATSALSLSDEVVDTNRRPLQYGAEYYIKPAITDSGGRFTLISRNDSCPLYVGQLNTDIGEGLPVTFMPQAGEGKVVKVNTDFRVQFSAFTTCVQTTLWKVGENDTKSGRRLIVTGMARSRRDYSNYFRIVKAPSPTSHSNIYNIRWCPTQVCPTCRFICGTIGGLRENGKILEALDGNVLPVVFVRSASSSFVE